MNDPKTNYIVSAAPHLRAKDSTEDIMRWVCVALIPAFLVGFYVFGWYSMVITALCVVSCAVTEAVCFKLRGLSPANCDYSAIVSGLLLAAVLPPNVSWWVPVVGGVFAMGIVKHAFGGLGSNIWNPALAARAFLQVSLPTQINSPSWPMIKEQGKGIISRLGVSVDGTFDTYIKSTSEAINTSAYQTLDIVSQATPLTKLMLLSADKTTVESGTTVQNIIDTASKASIGSQVQIPDYATMVWNSFIGFEPGCIAEVSAIALILGGIFLLAKKIITWEAPVFYILTVGLLTWVLPAKVALIGGGVGYTSWFSGPVLLQIFGGGLLIGAFFMDTDYVTTPMTRKGKIIFAIGCGVITAMIRLYSSAYPEGCCYSILLMNTCVPLIDAWTRPKVFGTRKKSS